MSVSEATKKRILRSYFSGKSFKELVKEYQDEHTAISEKTGKEINRRRFGAHQLEGINKKQQVITAAQGKRLHRRDRLYVPFYQDNISDCYLSIGCP